MKSISTLKKELIAKAKKDGLYENFGQKELRNYVDEYYKLHKVSIYPYYWNDQKHKQKASEVKEFDNWLMNLDMNSLKHL